MTKLTTFIRSIGGELNAPASAHDIDLLQKRIGVILPARMREFYLSSNGIKSPLDYAVWSWLPVGGVYAASEFLGKYNQGDDSVKSLFDPRKAIIFCDALYDAPAYAVILDAGSQLYGSVCGFNPFFVSAASYDRFEELFMAGFRNAIIVG